MKKIIIISLILLISISCKDGNKSGFKIDVAINDVPDNRKVFLKKQVDGKIIILDSTIVKNGKFTFTGKIEEPVILGVFIDSINRGAIFPFIDVNDQIKVTAYKDSLTKSKIVGSELNTELTRLRDKRAILTAESKKFLPDFQKANLAKDTIAIKRINKKIKAISDKMALNDWNYTKRNPDSYVSTLVFQGLMSNPQYKDSLNIVFNSFSDKVKNSNLSKPVRDYFDYLDKQLNKSLETPNKKSTKSIKIETH